MVVTSSGGLTVYTGPMYSGKTDALISQMKKYKLAGVGFIAFKSDIDKRTRTIKTRSGRGSIPAVTIPKLEPERMLQHVGDFGYVAVDEVQFFEPYIAEILYDFRKQGRQVFVAGLDLDFRAMPFPSTARVLAYADVVHKYAAVCKVVEGCLVDATRTQRVNKATGLPAPFDDPVELVQDELVVDGRAAVAPKAPIAFAYRSACDGHHDIPGKPPLEQLIQIVRV
jgi:thymidine kinase